MLWFDLENAFFSGVCVCKRDIIHSDEVMRNDIMHSRVMDGGWLVVIPDN